jgi:hypothetical protein
MREINEAYRVIVESPGVKIMGLMKSLLFKLLIKGLPSHTRVRGPSNITTEKDTVRVEVPQMKPNPEMDEKVRRLGEIDNELTAWKEVLRLTKPTSPLK